MVASATAGRRALDLIPKSGNVIRFSIRNFLASESAL